jgi:hypothetical protein
MRPLARPESSLRRLGRHLGFIGRPGEDVVVRPGRGGRSGSALRVQGRAVSCPICGNNRFQAREGKLQTTAMTLFGLDMFNASAVCHVCTDCGHILWFLP